MGGIMDITGEAGGPPAKVGAAIAGIMCGIYAATAILAALRHRDQEGVGQHIDLSLLDAQVSWLANAGRVRNRQALIPLLEDLIGRRPRSHWLDGLTPLNVPCGPVNAIEEVFGDPQVIHRKMEIAMPHALAAPSLPGKSGEVRLIGNPVKLSETPAAYRRAPPTLGEHTDEALKEILGMDDKELAALCAQGII